MLTTNQEPQWPAIAEIRKVFGDKWHIVENYELSRLDLKSRQIQVRDTNNYAAPADVARYAVQMGHTIFPPIIVTADDWLVDGNTRVAARFQRKDLTCQAIVVDVQHAKTTEAQRHLIIALGAALNMKNGRPLTTSELRRNIEPMVRKGWINTAIAAALGVGGGIVNNVRREVEAFDRLKATDGQFAGLDESNPRGLSHGLSPSVLCALGSKDPQSLNNLPFAELSVLAREARLPPSQIKEIAREAKAAGSDAAALGIINKHRVGLEDHIRTVQLEGASVPPPARQLRQHLGYVLKFEGKAHELIETNPAAGQAHIEVLEKIDPHPFRNAQGTTVMERAYGLSMAHHVQYVALSIEAAQAVSLDDLAAGYTPSIPTDLDRVRRNEGCTTDDEALKKLLRMAIGEMETRGERGAVQLVEEDGKWRFADGVTFEKLRWLGKAIPRQDREGRLRDPFNPHNGAFAENIRALGKDDPAELRESMREFGWIKELPALADERGSIIVGHRHIAVAEELGITKNITKITFGFGDEADASRVRLALASNLGGKPLNKADRKKIAEHLYVDVGWTVAAIAEAITVSAQQVSDYLQGTPKTPRINKAGTYAGSVAHPMAAAIVADILADPVMKNAELSRKHGVHPRTVSAIRKRATAVTNCGCETAGPPHAAEDQAKDVARAAAALDKLIPKYSNQSIVAALAEAKAKILALGGTQ